MRRIVSTLLILMMLITMSPTAFADVTVGRSGVEALTALIVAELPEVFGAYDTALVFVDDPATFYNGVPTFAGSISAVLPESAFVALYNEIKNAVTAMDRENISETEIYNQLVGVIGQEAALLIDSIENIDLDLSEGSNNGTVVYYLGKLAQEKKLAKYDTRTGKLEFDLGYIKGNTEVTVASGSLFHGSDAGIYTVSELFKEVFDNVNFDYDSVMEEVEVFLNNELKKENVTSDAMRNALKAFGVLNEYTSDDPNTGGSTGGGGVVLPPPTPDPEPGTPGEIAEDALEIETSGTVTTVSVDEESVETEVEKAQAATEGTVLAITLPVGATPTEVAEQVVIAIPQAAVEAIIAGGIDLELNLDGMQLTIPNEALAGQAGELAVQVVVKETPTSNEATIDNEGTGPVSTTKGLVSSFDINAVVTKKDGQTRLTDYSSNPLRFEYKLDQIPPTYYDTLGLYYYNPDTFLYEFIGGKIEGGKLIAKLPHLSEYAILNVVTSFTDMKGHWADRYVKSMAAKHVINGVGHGNFEPEASVTRAEFVKMLVGVKDLQLDGAPSFFTDVQESDWFKPYVDAAYANGLIYGGTVSSFMPNEHATRLEMMMMLSYAIDDEISKEEVDQTLSKFADQEEVAELHREAIAKVVKAGLITGSDGKLLLEDGLKRSEAATVMYRLFKK